MAGNPARVLIFGGTATRSALALGEQDGRFEVVGYVARTSLASQVSGPCGDERLLAAAGSARGRLEIDFAKTLLESIANTDFDWLLLDFIDERFHLYEWTPGAYVTASTELLKAAAGAKPRRVVRIGSPEYTKLWVNGLKALVARLEEQDRLDRLRINRLWWADRDAAGRPLECSSSEAIQQANERLARQYDLCRLLLGPDIFLSCQRERIRVDRDHRWGCAPYHYGRDTLRAVYEPLLTTRKVPIAPARLRLEVGSNPAQLAAQLEPARQDAPDERAFYLYRNGEHLIRGGYGQDHQARFERPREAGDYSVRVFLRAASGAVLTLEAALTLQAAPVSALKGARIIHQGLYQVGDHEPVELRPPVDWDADPFANRSWRWSFLQLDVLPNLLAYDETFGGNRGADLGWELIASWNQRFSAEPGHPEVWHDHCTAMRAKHLAAFYQWLCDRHLLPESLATLEHLLMQHAQCLSREDFYSRGTNHGFDQALALNQLAGVMPESQDRERFLQLARQRLAEEVRAAIAPDGGHVENSPAYLNYGIKQALEALPILHAGDAADRDHVEHDLQARLDRSVQALAHMIRPDGTLPLIGDTFFGKVNDFLRPFAERFANYPEFLYALTQGRRGRVPEAPALILGDSGYAIFRDAWSERGDFAQALHLVMKCGFLSTYHRHDDDLHFVLVARGLDWLVDGGLYNYHRREAQRRHLCSPLAHNLSLPYAERASRDPALVSARLHEIPPSAPGGSAVIGHSTLFPGYASRRRLDYDRSGGRLLIEDRIQATDPAALARVRGRLAGGEPGYVTRFQAPGSLQVLLDGQTLILRHPAGRRYRLELRAQSADGATLAAPLLHPAGRARVPSSWYARELNRLEPLHVIEYRHQVESLHVTFDVTLP